MSKIAIVSDSSCDLPKDIIKDYNIRILPLRVIYENAEYRDGVDIQPQEIYDRLEEEIPKTSLPDGSEIQQLFDQLVAEGYTNAICIALSSKLSGTYNLVRLIAEEYDQNKLKIEVVDTKTLSVILALIVLAAAKQAKAFEPVETILETIKNIRSKIEGCYVIKTLKYLKKGGRIGKVEGTVGELLDIKPIIGVNDDGIYYTIQKARGRKKSIQKMREMFETRFKGKKINLAIVQGGAEEEAITLMNYMQSVLNINESFISQLSPALGVHTGPGMLGMSAYEI